jgi:hypothetical protein
MQWISSQYETQKEDQILKEQVAEVLSSWLKISSEIYDEE